MKERQANPPTCTWCGHAVHHGQVCPSRIQTGVVKKQPVTEPCPCLRPLLLRRPMAGGRDGV